MLVGTRGVVLKCTKYSESSVVMQIFTEELGLQSYLINGIRKSKSRYSPAVMQPLQLLELVVYNREGAGIQRVAEIRNSPPYQDIPFNTLKSTLILFLTEVMYKSVRQGHRDPELFQFLYAMLLELDLRRAGLADYHIDFMLRLAGQLGIYPSLPDSAHLLREGYFDLKNGDFCLAKPLHPAFAEPDVSCELGRALLSVQEGSVFESSSRASRKALMALMLEYYAWHIDGFGAVRSWDVLEDVFR